MKRELNLRDLGDAGGGIVPKGMFWRSGKLALLTPEECANLCRQHRIQCVIDLRTPIEATEYPDPLPPHVDYLPIPLLSDSAIGITHETGSDPMTIIRSLRRHPEKLREMIPDFRSLYTDILTDDHSRSQLARAVATLRENARQDRPTLFHCTAGKDRTGILSMALLKSYGIGDDAIVKDYLATNRNALWPTLKKCAGVGLLTWNWQLVKTAFTSFMAQRSLIETALRHYQP